jgi:hypothetical protein
MALPYLASENNELATSFITKGKQTFLTQSEQLNFILALNRIFDNKIPYNRRNQSKVTSIMTIIREEPLKLAQYLREQFGNFKPVVF